MSLNCPKCNNDFSEDGEKIPKILDCGDSFCINCIKKSTKNGIIKCSLCNSETNKKIDELPTNKYAIQTKKLILCDLCMDEFGEDASSEKAPIILKCGHTFCLECLGKKIKNEMIKCSFCQKITIGKLHELPVNNCVLDLTNYELYINFKYLDFKCNEKENVDYQFSMGIMGETNGGKTSIFHYFQKVNQLKK